MRDFHPMVDQQGDVTELGVVPIEVFDGKTTNNTK